MIVAVIKLKKSCQLQFSLCSLKNTFSLLSGTLFMCLKNILIKEISPDVFLLVNTERKKSLKITVMFYSVTEIRWR